MVLLGLVVEEEEQEQELEEEPPRLLPSFSAELR